MTDPQPQKPTIPSTAPVATAAPTTTPAVTAPKWGDPLAGIAPERQATLRALADAQRAWAAQETHDLNSPFALAARASDTKALTGAEVFFLAAYAVASKGDEDLESVAERLRAAKSGNPRTWVALDALNLEGADLSHAHMEDAHLTAAHLENTHLFSAHLDRAFLRGTLLDSAILRFIHLEGADLHEAHLERTNLYGAHLERANLRHAHLEDAQLIYAHLNGAILRDAHLDRADFHDAHLDGIDLSFAHLEGADLFGAHLEDAHLNGAHLESADLSYVHLEDGDLATANLGDSTLRSAHLERANLVGAHLERANLHDAHLEGANLSAAHLEGANLSGAHLEGVTLREVHLERANLRGVQLDGVNLCGANLEGADLSEASLGGADLSGAWMDARTVLNDATLTSTTKLGDIQWSGVGSVNLTRIAWERTLTLSDECGVSWRSPVEAREPVVRAYRQLAAQLRPQGMNDAADRFAECAQICQRKLLARQIFEDARRIRRVWRVPLDVLRWLFSWFLALLAGYGFHPGRSLCWYLATVLGCAFLYYQLGPTEHVPFSPLGAVVFSVTSFHGRGFFPGGSPGHSLTLDDWVTVLAAVEAVVGLLIEISFIATFTQRFFGSR